jgi:transcriptional regulator with XRE-family HTH domain
MKGEELKLLRKEIGLTQAQLATALGMTQTSVGLMERGVNPIEWRTETVVRMLARETFFLNEMRENLPALDELALEDGRYVGWAKIARQTVTRNEEWLARVLAGRA